MRSFYKWLATSNPWWWAALASVGILIGLASSLPLSLSHRHTLLFFGLSCFAVAVLLFFPRLNSSIGGEFSDLHNTLTKARTIIERYSAAQSGHDSSLNNSNVSGRFFDQAASAGLFVGISVFEDERIPEVPFAVDDAVDLAHLFTLELGLVSPERSVLLLAGEPQKTESVQRLTRLLECGASRQSPRMREVYRILGELAQETKPPGVLLLTVATHGVSDQGGDFLLAMDSLRGRKLRTGVSVDELFDEVARATAERRIVLLDACRERFSQATRGEEDSTMSQSFSDTIASATGLVVLSAATLGGFAYDDRDRKNGVFTAAVLDGLHGEALPGPEGWITVRSLADFVQQQVVAWVRRNRPDHVAKSLGIARRIEATAEELPLALHPRRQG